MTNMTAHIVKARNLRINDQINILGSAFTITTLTDTGTNVFVCAQAQDEIGEMNTEGTYQYDQPITVFMPAEA